MRKLKKKKKKKIGPSMDVLLTFFIVRIMNFTDDDILLPRSHVEMVIIMKMMMMEHILMAMAKMI